MASLKREVKGIVSTKQYVLRRTPGLQFVQDCYIVVKTKVLLVAR